MRLAQVGTLVVEEPRQVLRLAFALRAAVVFRPAVPAVEEGAGWCRCGRVCGGLAGGLRLDRGCQPENNHVFGSSSCSFHCCSSSCSAISLIASLITSSSSRAPPSTRWSGCFSQACRVRPSSAWASSRLS